MLVRRVPEYMCYNLKIQCVTVTLSHTIVYLFQRKDIDSLCEHFSVIRPYLPKEQSHPEEGAYEKVNEDTWRHHMNELGQIEDDLNLRKVDRKTY